ncbi:hypothetical protein [Caproicibacter fermentans]|uniref:hypothetical protein n=1 Tax=Caproicibacter fermentans TaxID=2576756 RepID=UPI001E6486A0|nr:hypothetical protein [Caproicibacter fermentans]
MLKASDLLLRSNAVFTGSGERPRPGFVAVAGNRIAAVGGGTAPISPARPHGSTNWGTG